MSDASYLSELFRIIEGALRLDGAKVKNYALLLAEKLEADGDKSSAKRLRRLLEEEGHQLRPARLEQQPASPVDSESRFPLVQRQNIPESVAQFVFTERQERVLHDYLAVVRARAKLETEGVEAGTNLLLYGPPGCGKTHLAAYVAHELKLPMFVARLDGLISSFLGSTAKNIRAVFEFASRTPCVLLLDEFDAVAKLRDDHQELGELKRVVNSFIQNLDVLGRDLILIAATNHEQLLDPAVWRRFQHLLYVGLPDLNQREHLWELYSGDLRWSPKQLKVLADLSDGFSGASIQAVSTKLRQRMITHAQSPSLREAVSALLFMARGEASGKNPVDASVLDDLPKLTKLLQSRDSGIYSLAIVGELAGYSRATMSRLSSASQKRRSKANARRTPVHQSHPA